MRTRRGFMLHGLGVLLATLVTACGPTAVLPRVHVRPPLVAVDDHAVAVVSQHPTLATRTEVLTVTPGALTRGNLKVWVKRSSGARKLLVNVDGVDYKWLRRWQVAKNLVLLEIGTPPSPHPKSNEYLHVVLVLDARNGRLLFQGPVALTTIAYLDPPYLVKAGPASLLGRLKAVWLINLVRGTQVQVLFPSNTVGVGEVQGDRIHVVERLHGKDRDRTLAVPRTGWKPYKPVNILKVSQNTAGQEPQADPGGRAGIAAPGTS